MKTNIEKQICDAIEIIVNRAMAGARHDRTILANITSCVDEQNGKYKCKYQDSLFYAYAFEGDSYQVGDNVYILIPENDMGKDKIILTKLRRATK